MICQLSERVAKAATAFNLPSAIFSTDIKITIMLSNIITQKSEEKKKLLQLK
jgi:hypothetical protein